MKIIEPKIELQKIDGVGIMKNIEKACRTCYRSEGLITEDSYKTLLKNCINRGHESVLEHEKITVRLTCDVGAYKDLTRHRMASYSIESTRYCCYDKEKFAGEISYIKPVFYKEICKEKKDKGLELETEEQKSYLWHNAMQNIESVYMEMRKIGATPDECRMILPHSTSAEVAMTANIREWKHIFSLRAQKMTHPSVQQLMIPLLLYFKEQMPEIFDDVTYNEEYDKSKYAKIEFI